MGCITVTALFEWLEIPAAGQLTRIWKHRTEQKLLDYAILFSAFDQAFLIL
jgi:hypothetical protein